MILKEFLDLINEEQKISITKGNYKFRYQMLKGLIDSFDGVEGYKGMNREDAENVLRLSKITNISCIDSIIDIELDYVSVEDIEQKIRDEYEENGIDEEPVFKHFNNSIEIDYDSFIYNHIFTAEVMNWFKDCDGNYCIFTNEDIPIKTKNSNGK